MYTKAYYKSIWYTITMCPICNDKLIPVVYGHIDDRYLNLHRDGKIVLVGYRERYSNQPKSYCNTCFEGSDIAVAID